MNEVEYVASPTMEAFHKDDSFIRLLLGPIGSGKSVACCIEILRKACMQPLNSENVRKSRWCVIRNTYSELNDTTIQTFFDWIPQELGYWNQQQLKFKLKFAPGDGTIVDLEVLFRALDKPKDIRKLLSLELTGAWINEAREIPKAVLDMLMGRIGRYPSRKELDDYWHGVILDTNPCDVDHWIYEFFEEKRPTDWKLFHQPSGLSSEAENRNNLPITYYERMMVGKTQEWVNVYVHGKYGFVSDGKEVYPEFNDDVHTAKDTIQPVVGEQLYIGIDFGLTPAAVICQLVKGQWRVLDEVVTNDMGTLNFGAILGKHLREKYPGYAMQLIGDPAGSQRAQTDEQTPFMILSSLGLFAEPAYTNDFEIRREAVANKLTKMIHNGQPAFLISPKARILRKAMGGGYKFRRLQVAGEARFQDVPDKQSKYSHVGDAVQYALLGAGESHDILGSTTDWADSVNAHVR